MVMTTLRKLKRYESALREWRGRMAKGSLPFTEPKPEHYSLVRVEEIFCARKLRDKVMNEDYTEP